MHFLYCNCAQSLHIYTSHLQYQFLLAHFINHTINMSWVEETFISWKTWLSLKIIIKRRYSFIRADYKVLNDDENIVLNLNSREKFEPGSRFESRTSRSLPLEVSWFNWRYRSKSPSWKQCYSDVVVCDTICHDLTNELTSYYLFILIFSNPTDK